MESGFLNYSLFFLELFMHKFILYYDDWKRFPTAIVHTNTSNKTFLRQAEIFRRMGIRNCDFMLALLNPELEFVDPYDPNLTHELKEAVAIECLNNPWYFFREVARIEPRGGGGIVSPLICNRSIIFTVWCSLNGLNTFLVQMRQSGKSVGSDFLTVYNTFLAGRKSAVTIMTKDDDLRVQQIERIKGIRDKLPDYLNPYIKRLDGDNRETIYCQKYDNWITTAVPRSSAVQARMVGRGFTSPISIIDESPFIPHIGIIVPSLLGSTSRARKIARENQQLNYASFITTAGDRASESGAYAYSIYSGGVQWDEKLFLDSNNKEEVLEIVKKGRKGPMAIVSATFSHRQLGINDDMLEEIMTDNAAYGEEADRDYFNVWTNGGLSSPIPEELKKPMIEGIIDPLYTEVDKEYHYVTRWYVSEKEVKNGLENRRIVAGLDSSEGVGNDSIALVMIDIDTGEVVGCSDVNEANLFTYGLYLAKLIARFNKFVLIPERKSSGTALIDSLIVNLPKYGIDPFKVIYQTVTEDFWHKDKEFFYPVNREPLTRSNGFNDVAKRYFGFVTSSNGRHSRTNLFNRVMLMALKYSHINTKDRKLVEQFTGLVKKGDRLDHKLGGHDDLVIAFLLAYWFITSTPNLEWYGLGNPLTNCLPFDSTEENKEVDKFKTFLDNQQESLRKAAAVLLVELENTDDSLIAMRIEAKLNNLKTQILDTDKTGNTLDSMILSAKEKRETLIKEKFRQSRTDRSSRLNLSRYGHFNRRY